MSRSLTLHFFVGATKVWITNRTPRAPSLVRPRPFVALISIDLPKLLWMRFVGRWNCRHFGGDEGNVINLKTKIQRKGGARCEHVERWLMSSSPLDPFQSRWIHVVAWFLWHFDRLRSGGGVTVRWFGGWLNSGSSNIPHVLPWRMGRRRAPREGHQSLNGNKLFITWQVKLQCFPMISSNCWCPSLPDSLSGWCNKVPCQWRHHCGCKHQPTANSVPPCLSCLTISSWWRTWNV